LKLRHPETVKGEETMGAGKRTARLDPLPDPAARRADAENV
jgi:hypothetical protein